MLSEWRRPEEIRTLDPQIRRLALYSAELRVRLAHRATSPLARQFRREQDSGTGL
jgi:hypothetical protein